MHKINEKFAYEKQNLLNHHESLVKESNIKIYELKQQVQEMEDKYDIL